MNADNASPQPRQSRGMTFGALLTAAHVLATTVALYWAAVFGTDEPRLPAEVFMRFSLGAAAIIIVDGSVLASRPGVRRLGIGVLLGGIVMLAVIGGVLSVWALHAYGDA